MALIDVTDVLLDPDFMSLGLICERSTQIVGDDGLAVNTIKKIRFAGVVTSNTGDILERLAEGQRIKGSITIHTKFQLTDGSLGNGTDVIQWRGSRYTVSNVNDYSHFGRGFVAANCDVIPLTGG